MKSVDREPPSDNAARVAARVDAIVRAVAAIPRGRVLSYGDVAARAGLPGRARLVGRVLREAPASLGLPWHRVLRAGGRVAFPPGSRGFREQTRRLAAEGIAVVRGRVAAAHLGAGEDLDRILWERPAQPAKRVTKREKMSR